MATARYHALLPLVAGLLLRFGFVRGEATTGSQQDQQSTASWDNGISGTARQKKWTLLPVAGDRPGRPSMPLAGGNNGFPNIELRDVRQGDLKCLGDHCLVESLAAQWSSVTKAEFPLGARRGLQTQCVSGDSFAVTSALYPNATGCYSGSSENDDIYFTPGVDRVIFASTTASSSSSSTPTNPFWLAAPVNQFPNGTSGLGDVDCFSVDAVTFLSHPANIISWACLVDGEATVVSDSDFSTECGCSSSSSGALPGTTPAPVNAATTSAATSPSAAEGLRCNASSIEISSSEFDRFDGCYVELVFGNTTVFSQTGVIGDGSNLVFSATIDEDQLDYRWIVGTYEETTSGSGVPTDCLSLESALTTHPADSTWICDFTGTGASSTASETQFNVECGCSSMDFPSTISPTPIAALGSSPTSSSSANESAPSPLVSTPPPEVPTPSPQVSDLSPSVSTPSPDVSTPSSQESMLSLEVPTPSPEVVTGCDTLRVSSSLDRVPEGCYEYGEEGTLQFYSDADDPVVGTNGVFPYDFSGDGTDIRWGIGTISQERTSNGTTDGTSDGTSNGMLFVRCYSLESSATTHPEDSTWYCDRTGSSDFTFASDDDLEVTCGCDPTTNDGSAPTPKHLTVLWIASAAIAWRLSNVLGVV